MWRWVPATTLLTSWATNSPDCQLVDTMETVLDYFICGMCVFFWCLLGTTGLVVVVSHCSCQCMFSDPIVFLPMKFSAVVHDPHMMNLTDFGDPQTSPLALPTGQSFHTLSSASCSRTGDKVTVFLLSSLSPYFTSGASINLTLLGFLKKNIWTTFGCFGLVTASPVTSHMAPSWHSSVSDVIPKSLTNDISANISSKLRLSEQLGESCVMITIPFSGCCA